MPSAIEKFSQYPLENVISHTVEIETLAPEGIGSILQLMRQFGVELPNDFDWSKKNPQGRVSRRISQYAYEARGIRLPPDALTEIGNLYNQYYLPQTDYHFDFTQDFYWERGMFGDDKSCFWTDKLHMRLQLERAGAYAVRFFRNNGEGLGRAWLMKHGENLVVFNAYGTDLTIKRIGMVLSDWLGETKESGMIPAGASTDFWVNNHQAWLIGGIDRVSRHGITLYFSKVGKVGYCDICGHLTEEYVNVRRAVGIVGYEFRCALHGEDNHEV